METNITGLSDKQSEKVEVLREIREINLKQKKEQLEFDARYGGNSIRDLRYQAPKHAKEKYAHIAIGEDIKAMSTMDLIRAVQNYGCCDYWDRTWEYKSTDDIEEISDHSMDEQMRAELCNRPHIERDKKKSKKLRQKLAKQGS